MTEVLRRAHREREYLVVLIGVAPAWDALRADPRRQTLLHDMRLPAAA